MSRTKGRMMGIILSLIIVLCLQAVSAGAENAGTNDELYPKQAENQLWGYSDAAGNWVIPAQYQDGRPALR